MAELLEILILAEDDQSTEAQWWAAHLPDAWPTENEPVVCNTMSFAHFASLPHEHRPAQLRRPRADQSHRVVLVLCQKAPRSVIMPIIDSLLLSRSPVLALADQTPRWCQELEPQGILVDWINAPAKQIARALRHLAVRQAAVSMLAIELRIARAAQGGISGEMSRLHDELQLAGKLQRRFLPKSMPQMDGYRFGTLFRPCGYVSGDIYDIVQIDQHRIAFLLADAVGHGVPAALLTLVLVRALRHNEAHLNDPFATPAAILRKLNVELAQENDSGDRFATAVCGVLDTQTHELTLAGAGHPLPLLVSMDGSVEPIEGGQGPLLGVFEDATYAQVTCPIEPGQTLMLYSDGFETAFPESDCDLNRAGANESYITHFSNTVSMASEEQQGLQLALERLAGQVDNHAGSLRQKDDLTILAIGRMAQPDALYGRAG